MKLALVYPNTHHVAMSNLGFQALHALFNSLDDVICKEVFLPDEVGIKGLNSSLQDFPLVVFALFSEDECINILRILKMARIPLMSGDRQDTHPLIVAAGVIPFLNPEPLSSFIDLFIIGCSKANLTEFLKVLGSCQKKGLRRSEKLECLGKEVEGIYIPSLYNIGYDAKGKIKYFQPKPGFPERVKGWGWGDMSQYMTETLTSNVTLDTIGFIEVGQGCTHRCRLCTGGRIYGEPGTGNSSLCQSITYLGGKASFLVRNDALKEGLPSAPEKHNIKRVVIVADAGSERLRCMINKGITEQGILEVVWTLAQAGIKTIRLYFLIGLPTETNDDVEAIISLSKRIKHYILKSSRGKGDINLSLYIKCFVPRPFTSFQWVPFEDLTSLKRKIALLKMGLKGERNICVTFDVPKWTYVQALLARGDRSVGEILLAVHELNGDWQEACKAVNVNPDFYVSRRRDFDEILPWDFIDHCIEKDFLVTEYRRAMECNKGSDNSSS